MEPKHLYHRGGGRITLISHIGNRTHEGVAYWFFLCDVVWDENGAASRGIEVIPNQLYVDSSAPAGKPEYDWAMEKLNNFLARNGRWLSKPKWVGERLVHWVAKEPHRTEVMPAPAEQVPLS